MGLVLWPIPTGNIERDREALRQWQRSNRRFRLIGGLLVLMSALAALLISVMAVLEE
jgi:hypothetical protein